MDSNNSNSSSSSEANVGDLAIDTTEVDCETLVPRRSNSQSKSSSPKPTSSEHFHDKPIEGLIVGATESAKKVKQKRFILEAVAIAPGAILCRRRIRRKSERLFKCAIGAVPLLSPIKPCPTLDKSSSEEEETENIEEEETENIEEEETENIEEERTSHDTGIETEEDNGQTSMDVVEQIPIEENQGPEFDVTLKSESESEDSEDDSCDLSFIVPSGTELSATEVGDNKLCVSSSSGKQRYSKIGDTSEEDVTEKLEIPLKAKVAIKKKVEKKLILKNDVKLVCLRSPQDKHIVSKAPEEPSSELAESKEGIVATPSDDEGGVVQEESKDKSVSIVETDGDELKKAEDQKKPRLSKKPSLSRRASQQSSEHSVTKKDSKRSSLLTKAEVIPESKIKSKSSKSIAKKDSNDGDDGMKMPVQTSLPKKRHRIVKLKDRKEEKSPMSKKKEGKKVSKKRKMAATSDDDHMYTPSIKYAKLSNKPKKTITRPKGQQAAKKTDKSMRRGDGSEAKQQSSNYQQTSAGIFKIVDVSEDHDGFAIASTTLFSVTPLHHFNQ